MSTAHGCEEVIAADGSRAELLRRGNGVSINTLLILREAYLTIGGCDTSLTHAEDLDLVLRMLQVGDFAKVDRSLDRLSPALRDR